MYNEYKAKLDAWREKAQIESQRTIEQMEYFLRPFAEKELQGKKKQSFDLVNGKMGFRKLPDKIEWDATIEPELVEWAEQEMPWVVKVKKSISKTELMKTIKNGGEMPEGIMLVQGGDRFYIDVT